MEILGRAGGDHAASRAHDPADPPLIRPQRILLPRLLPGRTPRRVRPRRRATALREAFEEIHLAPGSIQLVGCLPLHKTRKRNHAIFPVIGIASDAAGWEAAPAEVEEIFEFPFTALLNPDLPRQYADGERAGSWYWADQPQDIWGVTAVILKSLAGLARAASPGSR